MLIIPHLFITKNKANNPIKNNEQKKITNKQKIKNMVVDTPTSNKYKCRVSG